MCRPLHQVLLGSLIQSAHQGDLKGCHSCFCPATASCWMPQPVLHELYDCWLICAMMGTLSSSQTCGSPDCKRRGVSMGCAGEEGHCHTHFPNAILRYEREHLAQRYCIKQLNRPFQAGQIQLCMCQSPLVRCYGSGPGQMGGVCEAPARQIPRECRPKLPCRSELSVHP